MRYDYIPLEWLTFKRLGKSSAEDNVEKLDFSSNAAEIGTCATTLEDDLAASQKVKHAVTTWSTPRYIPNKSEILHASV